MPGTVRAKKPQPTLTKKRPRAAAKDGSPNKEAASPGRESNGRFARGNPGGPGNPHARFSAQMLSIARQTMTAEKMVNVFEAIYVRALTGDINAAKLLLHYTIGKPGDAPHPDHIERDEWDLYQKNAMTLEEMKQALGSLPCSLGNEIVGAALPAMTAARANELAEQLRGEGAKKDEGEGMKDKPKGRRRTHASKSTQDQAAASVNPRDVGSASPLTNGKSDGKKPGDSDRRSAENRSPATSASIHGSRSTIHVSSDSRSTTHVPGDSHRRFAKNQSPATSHPSNSTKSAPLPNRISNGSGESKKGRKLVAKQWLQPLIKKVTGGKHQRKKQKPVRA